MDYIEQVGYIAYTVVGPLVVLAGAGYVLGRRLEAAADVLAKTLLYLLIPVFVFRNVLTSSLAGPAYGPIIGFTAAAVGVLGVLAWGAGRLRGHDRPLGRAFVNSVILYNSANFGIPVVALAFAVAPGERSDAVSAQVMVAVCQGFAAYTLGAFIAGSGSTGAASALKRVLRLPFFYAMMAALLLKHLYPGAREMDLLLRVPGLKVVWMPVTLLSEAYVPMALLTLGAQMGRVRLVRAPADLAWSAGLRLLAGPMVGLGLVAAMGLEGMLAQVLVIGLAGPSAVASAVVAIEFRNRPDFAASAVLVSTLGAGVTVPIVIFAVQQLF